MESARELATQIARAFDGRVRREELSWNVSPRCDFRVNGSHGGRPLTFFVFEGGCVVEGATTRKLRTHIAFNHPFARVEQPVPDVLPTGVPNVFHSAGEGGKAYSAPVVERIVDEVRRLCAGKGSREALRALALTGREYLALMTKPVFTAGRPAFYLLHISRDVAALEARLDVLGNVLPWMPEPVTPPGVSATAHAIRVARGRSRPGTRHRFGGGMERRLACKNCRTPVHLILTVDTRDPSLRLASLGRRHLPILYCLNCASWGHLHISYAGKGLRIVRQDAADRVQDEGLLEERTVTLERLASPRTSVSKIGGLPTWLQGAAVPDCARCHEPMAFLAQIKSTKALSFGDDGILYAFVCKDCRLIASFIQSS